PCIHVQFFNLTLAMPLSLRLLLFLGRFSLRLPSSILASNINLELLTTLFVLRILRWANTWQRSLQIRYIKLSFQLQP
ncbi:hypothetical protein L9F63_008668, partial [Diploptera punctata]